MKLFKKLAAAVLVAALALMMVGCDGSFGVSKADKQDKQSEQVVNHPRRNGCGR